MLSLLHLRPLTRTTRTLALCTARCAFATSHKRAAPPAASRQPPPPRATAQRHAPRPPTPSASAVAAAGVIEITPQNVNAVIGTPDKPVVLFVYSARSPECATISIVLANLVKAANGAWILGKLNADLYADMALQLNAQTVPTLIALHNRQYLNALQGPASEAQIRQFVQQLTKAAGPASTSPELLLDEAKQCLDEKRLTDAAVIYADLLRKPEYKGLTWARANAGLCRCAIAENKLDVARSLLDAISTAAEMKDHATHPDVLAAASALKAAESIAGGASVEKLREKLQQNPDDLQTRYDMASLLFATGQTKEALLEGVQLIRRDRKGAWNDGAARKLVLGFFGQLGMDHELTKWGRRQLANMIV